MKSRAPKPAENDTRNIVKQAAETLLRAYDNFLSSESLSEQERELMKSVSLAASFAAQAYEYGSGGQAIHALARAFLLAIIDPENEQLDYLRSDPKTGAVAREANAALRALAEKDGA